ncbi:MAG: PRC-barrel domain-containing protein [Ginsengibacter sp.]
MKRNIKNLIGFQMKETDGEIGVVEEFYFDDLSWTIRYLIVKTGNWLSGRKVLISPKVLQQPDWENNEFPVNLTKAQIENSPDIDTDKPVNRQQEEMLSSYYPWEMYWGNSPDEHGAGIFGAMPSELYESEAPKPEATNYENPQTGDKHLRSTEEVKGYTIHATNGEIGKVIDYIFDDQNWKIKYLVLDTGNWLNRSKVLVSTNLIKQVNWENSVVVVKVSTDAVKNSPEYDESQEIDEAYENHLSDYYGITQKESEEIN